MSKLEWIALGITAFGLVSAIMVTVSGGQHGHVAAIAWPINCALWIWAARKWRQSAESR